MRSHAHGFVLPILGLQQQKMSRESGPPETEDRADRKQKIRLAWAEKKIRPGQKQKIGLDIVFLPYTPQHI